MTHHDDDDGRSWRTSWYCDTSRPPRLVPSSAADLTYDNNIMNHHTPTNWHTHAHNTHVHTRETGRWTADARDMMSSAGEYRMYGRGRGINRPRFSSVRWHTTRRYLSYAWESMMWSTDDGLTAAVGRWRPTTETSSVADLGAATRLRRHNNGGGERIRESGVVAAVGCGEHTKRRRRRSPQTDRPGESCARW